MVREGREKLWLRRVSRLCRELAAESEPQRLFLRILDAALELTGAERGFLVIVEGRKPSGGYRFRVREARGFDKRALAGPEGELSRTIVRRVLDEGSLVATRDLNAEMFDVSSIAARRLLSIISVRMELRGEVRGLLYLDHSADAVAFFEDDLPILETFADLAALALDSAGSGAADSAEDESALIGSSERMGELRAQLRRVARSSEHVLILGESGSGKELVARELHRLGSQPDAPFCSENLAALPPGLAASELFGHSRGAFSGAVTEHPGLFIRARHGTLFLDEIGDMDLGLQATLLRVLQERVVRPVGARSAVPIQCRVVAATHRDLKAEVAAGRFREDLFYRLDVLRLKVPALRERIEDLPSLVSALAARAGHPELRLSRDAATLMQRWPWPGNVRELNNELRRLCLQSETLIEPRHLSSELRGEDPAAPKTMGEVKRAMIAAALVAEGGNKARCARRLGIPRSTLYRMIERFGLQGHGRIELE